MITAESTPRCEQRLFPPHWVRCVLPSGHNSAPWGGHRYEGPTVQCVAAVGAVRCSLISGHPDAHSGILPSGGSVRVWNDEPEPAPNERFAALGRENERLKTENAYLRGQLMATEATLAGQDRRLRKAKRRIKKLKARGATYSYDISIVPQSGPPTSARMAAVADAVQASDC